MSENANDESHDVHIGKNDFLFLAGGKHGVFQYFTNKINPSEASVSTFVQNHQNRSDYCANAGKLFKMVVFPEKCVALRHETRIDQPIQSLFKSHYSSAMLGDLAASILYPLNVLDKENAAFMRTDTHYSARGNLKITQSITQDIFPEHQASFEAMTYPLLKYREDVCGDLGRKFTPQRREAIEFMTEPAVSIRKGVNGIQGGNDGNLCLLDSPHALTGKTLLIFGDSFFSQILLMLAVFYKKVAFCRTRFFHYELVDAFRPDHIFCGCAERYLSHCSSDKERPHFLSYPLLSDRTMQPDKVFVDLWSQMFDRDALLG